MIIIKEVFMMRLTSLIWIIATVVVIGLFIGCDLDPDDDNIFGNFGNGANVFVKSTNGLVSNEAVIITNTRNNKLFTKSFDDFLILLPDISLHVQDTSRVTITAKCYGKNGVLLPPTDSQIMVTLIYDPKGDIKGPSMLPGPNTPVKEFNLGGFSGMIHKDRGVRVDLIQAPKAILFNNTWSEVAYIELTGLIFHNGDYSSN